MEPVAENDPLEHALWIVSDYWNETQPGDIDNPFGNNGAVYDGEAFSAHAFSWNDEDQPWNFKWRDLTVRWYKYFPRDLLASRRVSAKESVALIMDCCREISKT